MIMALQTRIWSVVKERLCAAAEEICGAVETLLAEHQAEAARCKAEVERQRALLAVLLKLNPPLVKLHRAGR